MGREILYCSTCRTQLRGGDFEKGKAHKGEGEVLCRACYQAEYKALPPKLSDAPPTSHTPSRGTPSKSRSTSRIAIIPPPPAPEGSPSSSGLTAALLGGGAVVALLLAVFALNPGGSRAPVSTRSLEPPPDVRAVSAPNPPSAPRREAVERETRESPVPRAPERREETARASLRTAIDSEKRQPTDFDRSASLYEQALWDAKETPVYSEAKAATDAFRARQRQAILAELAPFAERVLGLMEREQFGAALEAIESMKPIRAAAPWRAVLDERLEEVRSRAARAFLPLKEKAVEARRQGRAEEVASLKSRIGAWGIPSITKDLDEALAAAAPPPPPASTDPLETYRTAWSAAMLPCTGRDFLEAAKAIEAVAAPLKDRLLRAEATADADLLRKAASLTAEAMDLLSKAPKGRDINLSYVDSSGARVDVRGQVVRTEPFRLTLLREKELLVVDLGEILASSLAELLSRRPGGNAASDAPALALLCLAEGNLDGARKFAPGATLPNRYWTWAEGLRGALEAPDALQAEASARSLFAAAERDSGSAAGQAQGVLKARTLLADYGRTRFLRRNRASINALAEEARDYVFLAEDLVGGGTFKLTRGKSASIWTSDSDSETSQRKHNFVDLDFSALRELRYRCWVYVGGCCAETMAFGVQGNEMMAADPSAPDGLPMEPGADPAVSIKHAIAASTKTHASHGGRKQPSHWGWVEIPLPQYTSEGARKLRIVTDQQGFSMGAAVVSATRKAPPTESEIRDLERARAARSAGNTGLLTGSLERAAAVYDLTKGGTLDWAYWGRGGTFGNFDHKGGGGGQISTITETGMGSHSGTFAQDARAVTWTDGAPTRSGTNEHSYVWSNGALNTGFSFSCAAATTRRTLVVYCGASTAAATLTASLSDSSTPVFVASYDGPGAYLCSISFRAASPNQTLRVSLLKSGNHPGFTEGSVDLIAVMLR